MSIAYIFIKLWTGKFFGSLARVGNHEPRTAPPLRGHGELDVYIRGCDRPCGSKVLGWYVKIYLGPINMHIKRYTGNCGTCGMGINSRIWGYLHLRCQNRGAVHATTSNTFLRTITTHDMPVALNYFPSGWAGGDFLQTRGVLASQWKETQFVHSKLNSLDGGSFY